MPQEPSWRRRPSYWALKTKLWTRFDVEGTVCTASPEGSCDGSPTCVTAEDEGDGDQEEGMGSWPPTASGCPWGRPDSGRPLTRTGAGGQGGPTSAESSRGGAGGEAGESWALRCSDPRTASSSHWRRRCAQSRACVQSTFRLCSSPC